MVKKDVIKEFISLNGVGKVKAEIIYNSGLNSLEKLSEASIDDLIKIKGIDENLAKNIINQLSKSKLELTKEKTTKPEEISEKKEVKKHKKEENKETTDIIEEKITYQVKRKPELDKKIKQKLIVKNQIKKRRPKFLREEWFRYKRISNNWRKPDGITSKMRVNLKYRPKRVRVGFRGPKKTRGLHPSGFEEIAVNNINDIEKINPKTQAVRIGSTVGTRKRIEIEKKAEELDIRILNRGNKL